ncbi:MAG: hypothetical protein GF368_05630 [Candidatus Aenigmarchaeota archaeon]|nr:hypothetical protein [Candidatus Aenigmarchaeota archaeon]
MKKMLMVFLVLGIMVFSGCTDGMGGGGGAPSIRISDFGPLTIGTQAQPVRNRRPVTITAIFKNEGGAEVPDQEGRARLIGLGSDWTWDSAVEQQFGLKPGQERMVRWRVISPETSNYVFDIAYPVEVRYEFPYGTAFRGVFAWLSEAEYNTIVDSGDQVLIEEALQGKGLTVEQSSLGPVGIDLEEVEFIGQPEVKLRIENRGSGHLLGNTVTLDTNNLVCEDSGNVELINGQFETYCDVVTAQEGVPTDITVTINYNYYVSDTTEVHYHDTGRSAT